jgi:hypothetical protein
VDYDLLTNYLTEKHFEDLVINKLKLKANWSFCNIIQTLKSTNVYHDYLTKY